MWCALVKYSCKSGSPTIERELPFHRVHPPGVLGHTLVRAGVLLLEIRDFQDTAGFPHVHFPGEGYAIHPPPVYGRHRAARRDAGNFMPLNSQLSVSSLKDLLLMSEAQILIY